MSTTATISTKNKVLPVKSNGNLAASLDREHDHQVLQQNRILAISNSLQSTLNTEEMLTRFANEISEYLHHDHVSYINEQRNINFTLGRAARHSCTYELTINEEALGFFCVSRKTKFSNTEIETLEDMLCALHYPLRNALQYKDAVNAALKDSLTGIGNRGAMNVGLHREIELAFRHNRCLGIIMMDVDHFKHINDGYGHNVGDFVLQSIVECAEKSVRISDIVYRYGGEEFVIVLPETDETGVLRLAKRVRRRVEKLDIKQKQHTINVTVSLGITTLREADDEKTLIARADRALYRAKRDGRNCIRIATNKRS